MKMSLSAYSPEDLLFAQEDLRTPEDEECGVPGPDGLVCTRPDGHYNLGATARFIHVAHVENEPVAMWVNVTTSFKLKERSE